MSDFSESQAGKDLAKIGSGLSKAGKSASQDSTKPYADQSTSYHKGGTIPADGTYQLQAGEHVLTAAEAETARKHALMVSGLKSLAKPAKKAKTTKSGSKG
jgi:hypothetical protein